MATVDRLERLTDLVLCLVNTERPLSLREIAARVPGYPQGHAALRQAFERDKRALREEGIPVLTVPTGDEDQYGYRIEPDQLYLPDIALSHDEQVALNLAVAAVPADAARGRDALEKLGFGIPVVVPPAALLPTFPLLARLFEAVRQRASTRFAFRGSTRTVDPRALVFRSGQWYLAAWDRERQAPRTFRVDRIGEPVSIGEPGSAASAGAVDPASALPEGPWSAGSEEETEAVVRVDAVEGPRAVAEAGAGAAEVEADGSALIRLRVTNRGAFRAWVLSMLDHAEVVGPPELRDEIVGWLDDVVASGRGAGPDAGARGGSLGVPAGDRHEAPLQQDQAQQDQAQQDQAQQDQAQGPTSGAAGGVPGPERAASGNDARSRLRRLLAMLAVLARAGEMPLAELAERFSVDPATLVAELEMAACCGLPPYTPDQLVDLIVYDDRVEARLGAELARPRRLTAAEGLALTVSARAILGIPGADPDGALAAAVSKLESALAAAPGAPALPAGGSGAGAGPEDLVRIDLDRPDHLQAVRGATQERRRLEIDYYSASRDEVGTRQVDPCAVQAIDGHWYLDAWCRTVGGLRRFRVDRIRSVRATGEAATACEDALPSTGGLPGAPAAFVPGPASIVAHVAVGPGTGWVLDAFAHGVDDTASGPTGRGGERIVALPVGGEAWLARILLALGAEARVVDPPELAGVGIDAARRVLARYR